MWTDLYIISLILILIGIRLKIKKTEGTISINISGNVIGRLGLYLICITTICYLLNLIKYD